MVKLYATFLIIFVAELTVGYPEWKLAFNIHGADGHNFGYAAEAWQDNRDVGTDANAFSADYKSYDATLETANFIAIVRHQDGICEAARVWEFLKVGNTLQSYLDWDLTSRLVATYDHYTYSYISPTTFAKIKDPIFNVNGALVFNWWYADNGVRIGNRNNYCSASDLPGEAVNSNDFLGLGNEVSGQTKAQTPNLWFDVGVQDCNTEWKYRVQGSDHGAAFKNGTLFGQYAVYISNEATTFPCKGIKLQISMDPTTLPSFVRIDRGEDNFLNYDEFTFSTADDNKDDVLSKMEYSEARSVYMFVETATDATVLSDFERVDKNQDEVLTFLEIAFDSADINKDGTLSVMEYTGAREHELLGRRETDTAVLTDYLRIDKDGDERLSFYEIAFDAFDNDKDGELSLGEYSLAHAD